MSQGTSITQTRERQTGRVQDVKEEDGVLRFTLKGVNYSVANALRRTVLSDIPTVGFRVFPHAANEAEFEVNTSRLNNEILKQRLGCIPVHIKDQELPYRSLTVEIDVTNDTESVLYVTTEHFSVKDSSTDRYLERKAVQEMFPPDPLTGDYILFARLRPKLSNEVPGEAIKIKAKLSMQTASTSSMYNVCSACSYGMTPDKPAQAAAWKKVQGTLSEPDEDSLAQQDWYNHDARRIFLNDSFDFRIETIGVFTNRELVQKACEIISRKLDKVTTASQDGTLAVKETLTTMANAFDVTLEGEGYTLGKLIEAILHENSYSKQKILSYVGFRKAHPHDTDSNLRLALKGKPEDGGAIVRALIKEACGAGVKVMGEIAQAFQQ